MSRSNCQSKFAYRRATTALGKLTARKVETTTAGRYGDGGGLWLEASKSGAKRWLYRFTLNGKVSETGLGSYPDVSLAEAREKAAEARKLVKSGVSPVQAKREARRAEAAKPTFGQCADDFLAAKGAEWRNAKHCSQWAMTLREYCAPFRGVPVDQIDTEAVLSVLTPLWSKVPETAARLRGRIEAILDAARARGFIPRNEANPARWRGHLERLLPKRQKLTRGHHAAMPYADVPAFIARLRERKGSAAQALEFCVLTAARSGEVLGARWDEIDVVTRVWTIPAKRMKPGREHRVPLSARAMELLEGLAEARTGEYVFPGRRSGRTLNETAMQQLLGRMGVDDATIHGFRSSFRDWAGHETAFSREVCEQALSHRLATRQSLRIGAEISLRSAGSSWNSGHLFASQLRERMLSRSGNQASLKPQPDF